MHDAILLVHIGCIPTIVLSSVEAVRGVLKTNDLYTCSWPRLIGPRRLSYNYLDITFSPYGHYWREILKLCILELFSTKRVDGFRFVREEEVEALVEQIRESVVLGSTFDLSECFMRLSARIVSRVTFWRTFQGMGFDNGKEFMDIVHEAMAMLGSFSAMDFLLYFGWINVRFSGFHERLEKNFCVLDRFDQWIINIKKKKKKISWICC